MEQAMSVHREPPRAVRRAGFSLVELLVVMGIIALLLAVLLPALSKARRQADRVKCLANLRNMALAHCMYVNDNNGFIIQAGLAHGGAHANEQVAWINTLQRYYQVPLLRRCPSDTSIHWSEEDGGGVPVPASGGHQFRRTSYGINNFLDAETCPWGGPYVKINQIRRTAAVIQFIEMPYSGPFAGSDHPHVETWFLHPMPPAKASEQMQLHAHGGQPRSWAGVANYGFLDGHAESLPFREVFVDINRNRFDPQVAN
jgi:prepilin-type N-terminal cleavage/methylation domain-containing protein/prepilin-type processing-associated H-X9-DG protein